MSENKNTFSCLCSSFLTALRLSTLLLFFSLYVFYAQPTLEWMRLYPDTSAFSSRPYALTVDDSGNVYTTGESEANGFSWYSTIKYNSNGIQQWVSSFFGDTAGGNYPNDIAFDNQSNVYVTGYTYTKSTNFFDFCTI